MKHPETYIVDLNDLYDDQYVRVSRRHTRQYGRGYLVNAFDSIGLQEGDHIEVYSGDEGMTFEARVAKKLTPVDFAVEVYWESGRFADGPRNLDVKGATPTIITENALTSSTT